MAFNPKRFDISVYTHQLELWEAIHNNLEAGEQRLFIPCRDESEVVTVITKMCRVRSALREQDDNHIYNYIGLRKARGVSDAVSESGFAVEAYDKEREERNLRLVKEDGSAL